MKKVDLVDGLRMAGRKPRQADLAEFLADYFDNLVIPADEKYDFWNIDHYLPRMLLDAIEQYRLTRNTSFPDLTTAGPIDVLEQAMALSRLTDIIADVTHDDHLASEVEKFFTAEQTLLRQGFQRFVDHVHRKGLFDIIATDNARGMSGEFGKTTLRSYVMAGRLMYTFARARGKSEENVTFICEEEDPLAMSAGIQSCYTSLATALAMFSDVIKGWPTDEQAQRDIYVGNRKVALV
jgi:hypothetical protein